MILSPQLPHSGWGSSNSTSKMPHAKELMRVLLIMNDIKILVADDYVHKPFSPSVLVVRVQSLLKRSGTLKGEIRRAG